MSSNTEAKKPLFQAGKLATTFGVHERMKENKDFNDFVQISLGKHLTGNWGEVHEEDEGLNDLALEDGSRIFSVYVTQYDADEETKIWIITDADRANTTVLFPHEY